MDDTRMSIAHFRVDCLGILFRLMIFVRAEESWVCRGEVISLNEAGNGCCSGGHSQVDTVQLFWPQRDQL